MSDDEEDDMLATVDAFDFDDVADVLREMTLSAKAEALLRAFAAAPNRTMTRLQLAQVIGADHENACNSILGPFASSLVEALNDDEAVKWRRRKYFIHFVVWSVQRPDLRRRADPDDYAFVMREGLARALAAIGVAPFVELSEEISAELYGDDEEEGDPLDAVDDPLADIEDAQPQLAELAPTERLSVMRARIGQGVFRDEVLERWDGCCAVTGVSVGAVLVASHLKPWRDCTNDERLDPCNGLPLIGTLDRLFDAGLITFFDDGRMLVSSVLPEDEFGALGVSHGMRLREARAELAPFLKFHRDHRFRLESRLDSE